MRISQYLGNPKAWRLSQASGLPDYRYGFLRPRRSLARALSVLMVLLAGPPAWSQEPGSEEIDPPAWAWYTIRPGDTIEGLTVRYLGSRDRWRENARLNRELFPDPNRVEPGQRIKLVLPSQLPSDGALMRKLSNRVDGQPTPLEWTSAREQDLLRARDGVRTGGQSSAELTFPDDSALLVTERSLVFIGDQPTAPAQVDRTQIEIVVGQADLEGPSGATEPAERFEIVLGDVKATPRAEEGDAVQTRARRPEDGGAQLMVYGGESELEAAGAKVMVAAGMGSSVPKGEAPKPPEKLLPAPADLAPVAGSELATPRPAFRWAPVEGAAGYTLEICRDPRCGALLERVTELTETSWKPAGLPVAKLYWRVTALSRSGLDGYPSEASGFEILTDVLDTAPPEITVGFTGPRLAPRSGLNDRWIVGPGMTIEIEVEDAGSGVREWTPAIDGDPVAPEALDGPWTRGEHEIRVISTDRAGNVRQVDVPFIFDPDPPELSWGVEGGGALGRTAGEPNGGIAAPTRAWRGRREMRIGKRDWQLDSDFAEVIVRPRSGKPIGLVGRGGGTQTEAGGSLGRDQGLWVLARDAVCLDLDDLSYELVPGPGKGDALLRVEAIDCVGNTRRAELPLVKQK